MANVDCIHIHRATHAVAKAHISGNSNWLNITFDEGDCPFRVSIFMDYGRAVRLAQAFNEAWPEPADDARDPVIDWPRPSYHKQAVEMRAEDMLPAEDTVRLAQRARATIHDRESDDPPTLDALNGDDTPPDAA